MLQASTAACNLGLASCFNPNLVSREGRPNLVSGMRRNRNHVTHHMSCDAATDTPRFRDQLCQPKPDKVQAHDKAGLLGGYRQRFRINLSGHLTVSASLMLASPKPCSLGRDSFLISSNVHTLKPVLLCLNFFKAVDCNGICAQ